MSEDAEEIHAFLRACAKKLKYSYKNCMEEVEKDVRDLEYIKIGLEDVKKKGYEEKIPKCWSVLQKLGKLKISSDPGSSSTEEKKKDAALLKRILEDTCELESLWLIGISGFDLKVVPGELFRKGVTVVEFKDVYLAEGVVEGKAESLHHIKEVEIVSARSACLFEITRKLESLWRIQVSNVSLGKLEGEIQTMELRGVTKMEIDSSCCDFVREFFGKVKMRNL